MVFLNHGSFGATPRVVLEAQDRYRAQLEAEPVRFMVEQVVPMLDGVRADLAPFIGADQDGLVFVPNATTATQTVLHNTPLAPGDELLFATHDYPAMRNQFRHACERSGATLVDAEIPWPVPSEDAVAEAILSRITPRTRLVLLSHITSPTAAVLPVRRIGQVLREKRIDVLVDAAHAPGQINVDLADLQPTYYTANCHKWICSPKGSALLWVAPEKREAFRPIILSNSAYDDSGSRRRLHTEFDYVGTTDPTAWLAIKDALAFMGSLLPGGWEDVRRSNRDLALKGRTVLCEALDVEPPVPESMVASIATVILPPLHNDPAQDAQLLAVLRTRPSRHHDALQDALMDNHAIEVPVWVYENRRMIRISAQLYNTLPQYEYLAQALLTELDRERKWLDSQS